MRNSLIFFVNSILIIFVLTLFGKYSEFKLYHTFFRYKLRIVWILIAAFASRCKAIVLAFRSGLLVNKEALKIAKDYRKILVTANPIFFRGREWQISAGYKTQAVDICIARCPLPYNSRIFVRAVYSGL